MIWGYPYFWKHPDDATFHKSPSPIFTPSVVMMHLRPLVVTLSVEKQFGVLLDQDQCLVNVP